MYATGYDKVGLKSQNIMDFIKADIENYTKADITINKLESLKTHDNRNTYTYEFIYLNKHQREVVSYIDTETAVCMLVFAYIDRNNNQKYFEDYKSPFVKSFHYLGDDPKKAQKVYNDFMKKYFKK